MTLAVLALAFVQRGVSRPAGALIIAAYATFVAILVTTT